MNLVLTCHAMHTQVRMSHYIYRIIPDLELKGAFLLI